MVMSIHGVSLFYVMAGYHWLCFCENYDVYFFMIKVFWALIPTSTFHGVLVDPKCLLIFSVGLAGCVVSSVWMQE
jgi:hypothetical protein